MSEPSKVGTFFRLYLVTSRPYYAFVTGFAGWAGIAASQAPLSWRMVLALLMLFTSWGINQIVNDFLGLEEDRINAPQRPMVSGALNIPAALGLSAVLMAIASIIAYQFSPSAVGVILIGCGLNVAYEYAKAIPVLATLVFGVMIALCYYFGLLFMSPLLSWAELASPQHLTLFVAIGLANSTMTYFTYFKDYEGDLAAGKHTLVIVLGAKRAGQVGWFMALLPFAAMLPLARTLSWSALSMFAVSFAVALYTALRYHYGPVGARTYFNLKWNFRACILFQASVIGIFQPALGAALGAIGFVAVSALFKVHTRHPSMEISARNPVPETSKVQP